MIIIWHRGSTLRYPGRLYELKSSTQQWSTQQWSNTPRFLGVFDHCWRPEALSNFSYGASFSIKVFMWCYDFANIFGNACSPVVARSPTIHKSIGMNNTPRPKCAPIEFRHFEISGECWYRMSVSYLPERDIHFRSTNRAEIPLVHFLWP